MKYSIRSAYLWAGMGLSVILLTSCGTVNVPMQVTHPAEINMTPYKQIALGEITGNFGQSTSDAIKNQLVEGGRFQVVERSRMDQIMKELNLSQSDLTDASNRAKLGKLMSASAMIAGRAEGKYEEKLTKDAQTCTDYSTKPAKKYACTLYERKGSYKTNGSIDVIDIQTGLIIKSKPFTAGYEKSNTAYDGVPENIDKDALGSAAMTDNVMAFIKAISPWNETVQAPFLTDKAIPELQSGVNKAKMGDLQEAAVIFANAAKAAEGNGAIKPKSIAMAYFDLGLTYQYTDEFDKAIEAFKKAYSLNPIDFYLKEKAHAEKLKAEKKKLLEQGVSK